MKEVKQTISDLFTMKAVLTASNQAGKDLTSASASFRLKDLPTPAFVINRHAIEKNCRTMLEMAKDRGLSLRPHVKTHKTPQGACIQVEGKVGSAEQHETLGRLFIHPVSHQV
jgi:hypothetical protein